MRWICLSLLLLLLLLMVSVEGVVTAWRQGARRGICGSVMRRERRDRLRRRRDLGEGEWGGGARVVLRLGGSEVVGLEEGHFGRRWRVVAMAVGGMIAVVVALPPVLAEAAVAAVELVLLARWWIARLVAAMIARPPRRCCCSCAIQMARRMGVCRYFSAAHVVGFLPGSVPDVRAHISPLSLSPLPAAAPIP